jgi:signal transduction histidine kinase
MADSRRRWRLLATIRARTVVAATLVVAITLTLGAVSLLVVLRRSLVHNVDQTAEVHAEDIATLARGGTLPSELSVPGDDDVIAQVVDARGDVVASSGNLTGEPAIATFPGRSDDAVAHTVENLPTGDDTSGYRVVALAARSPGGPITIYVAGSLEPVDESVTILRGALFVGVPLVLAVIALTTWLIVGRALHPVEAIRTQVAAISSKALGRRVPEPKADDEIGRLARTMNEMLDRLEESTCRQRRFVADASHELQSPLASARADLEVALAHPEAAEWRDTAKELLDDNRQMERLIRDLLFLARADEGTAPAPTASVDFDDIVLEEVERLRPTNRLAIDTSQVSGAPVKARRDELGRAVRNLVENAERHATSAVRVELAERDHVATLIVEDDGPGIPPADRDRVFERFTRLDDARSRESGGTGLGLAIVKEIVESHGGTVRAEDGGRGARFVVSLPTAG